LPDLASLLCITGMVPKTHRCLATFFTVVEDRIEKMDPKTGRILAYDLGAPAAPVTATGRIHITDGKRPAGGRALVDAQGKSHSTTFCIETDSFVPRKAVP
jgi:hypothetical protein